MKNFFTVFFIFFINIYVNAQQDAMFTKYMFNSLVFNPAYAGSTDYLSVGILHRHQWWGIEGAPLTQSLTVHTPVKERIGVGLSIVNDRIGSRSSTGANLIYAYKVQFGTGKLSLALQAGAMNWRADWGDLKYKDPKNTDEVYKVDNPNLWLPNFGAGLYYFTDRFYVGFSVPHLLKADLRKEVGANLTKWAKWYPHFYITGGAAIPITGSSLVFKPSLLIKSVGLFSNFSSNSDALNSVGAPTEFDIDLSFLFYNKLWLGVSFRSAIEAMFGDRSSVDSGDFWISYVLSNGLRIGAAYDYTLTPLQEQARGSYEIMIGYDFNYNISKISTPRYF